MAKNSFMATEIKMPDLGTTVDQVKLGKWLKNEGEEVKRGDLLCEVATDKASLWNESFLLAIHSRDTVADTAGQAPFGSWQHPLC